MNSAERALAEHALTLAREDEVEDHVPSDLDWQWEDLTLESINPGENGDGYYEVFFVGTAKEWRKVARKTLMHPPEFNFDPVPIHAIVRFYPDRNQGFGEASVVVEMA